MFYYEEKRLTVINYKRLVILNEQEVIFDMCEYQLIVKGLGLYVSFFEKLEVHICGQVLIVEMKPC